MKRILTMILVCLLLMSTLASGALRKTNKKRKQLPNTEQTLDSLHWLIERHCDIITESMGNDGTLNSIVHKFRTLPPRVADSLLAAQYDNIVQLFEQERNKRAYALTDCYYALAKDDDPNLGTLYLNDIVLAIEQDDSVKLRRRINCLAEYAARNNLDYDLDLAEAEQNMALVRRRVTFKNMTLKELTKHNEIWVCDYIQFAQNDYETYLKWMPYNFTFLDAYSIDGYTMMSPVERNKYYNTYELKKPNHGMTVYTPYSEQRDPERKTYFIAMGTEHGGSGKPQLTSFGRQTVQNVHAAVTGELARKKYSTAKRIAGEAIVTLIDVGLNTLFDQLSVTTQTAVRCELSLTMTSPDVLEGFMNVAIATFRSDQPDNAKTKAANIPTIFYRTKPEEGLYLLNFKSEPIMYAGTQQTLFETEKKKIKAQEKVWKKELKIWKKTHKGEIPKFETYVGFRNDSVLTILRERAINSINNIPLK